MHRIFQNFIDCFRASNKRPLATSKSRCTRNDLGATTPEVRPDRTTAIWAGRWVRVSTLARLGPAQRLRPNGALSAKQSKIVVWRTKSCEWRRECQSIPIEKKSIFDLLRPKPTIRATAENWRLAAEFSWN